eukprot:Blabericola_migrator_1__8258@NODE_4280_length_1241_cov_1229_448041_g2642_i0_p1_GENE_NODE_4280_length_1241_cov_1229_448041_g2642_i0NODE_4280_length_1241_cov_1229_448041_g2642_i0_p1_ORF_typecomplete_len374_score54_64Integrin_beta/PF00362_18/6_4e22Integrin_beta/PF00362_18/2e03VWA/PF00092_28/0_00024VWA_2/PF13519_6/0_086VWA_2/PF13519_6/1_3e04FAP/PF07174_11/2_4e02FAP/PF07174_11/0_2Podoplanin/PF05808_11/0_62Dicty_REP/PF05086_12/1_7MGC24/PF05283_11/9_3_NODE_4280_length_1241_cov_1229_448041_g2642_i048116
MRHASLSLLLAVVSGAEEDRRCTPGVDIVFLQDTTESFTEFLEVVSDRMPSIAQDILELFPESRFGVADFRDKPIWPHGFRDDHCYINRVPLTTDVEKVRRGYASLWSSGGADVKEGHYFGIINLIYDETMGWSNDGRPKLIVMSTDARPHLNNDYLTDGSRSVHGYEQWGPFNFFPEYMPPYPGRPVNTENVTEDCMIYDHPSWEDMQAAILDNDFYLASFIPSTDANVVSDWNWVNDEALGQDTGFVNYVTMEGVGFSEAVLNALRVVGIVDCEKKTTTAPETTTVVTESQTDFPTTGQSTAAPTQVTKAHTTDRMTEVPTSTQAQTSAMVTEGPRTEPLPTREPEGGIIVTQLLIFPYANSHIRVNSSCD